jgi:hypothetical protein
MPLMNTKRQPQFTLVKPVRFAPEDWEKIRARAAEVRLPPSTYVRQTALGYRLSGRINSAAVAALGRIGNNLLCAAAHNKFYVQRSVMWSGPPRAPLSGAERAQDST